MLTGDIWRAVRLASGCPLSNTISFPAEEGLSLGWPCRHWTGLGGCVSIEVWSSSSPLGVVVGKLDLCWVGMEDWVGRTRGAGMGEPGLLL